MYILPTETKYAPALVLDKARQSAVQKKAIKDFNLNSRVLEDLIIAIDGSSNTGRVACSLLDWAKTTDLLDSNSALAYMKLREKYAPQSDPSYVRMDKMCSNLIYT